MSDNPKIELNKILQEELNSVTPAMIEAASKTAVRLLVKSGQLTKITEAELMTNIWKAMLAAKLGYN